MNRDIILNQVYGTKDYGKFVFVDNNREVTENIKLKEDIEKLGILIPIVVNEKMEVMDGQHRIRIAGQLGITVPYIVEFGFGKQEFLSINTTPKNWNLLDYVKSHAMEGIQEYIDFKELIENYNVNIGALCGLAFNTTDGNNPVLKVKNKKLDFVNLDFLKSFLEFHDEVLGEMDVKNKAGLTRALYVLFRLEKLDTERILRKTGAIANKIKGVTQQAVITQLILEEYNKGLRSEATEIQFHLNARDGVVFFEKSKAEIRGLDGTSSQIYKLDKED